MHSFAGSMDEKSVGDGPIRIVSGSEYLKYLQRAGPQTLDVYGPVKLYRVCVCQEVVEVVCHTRSNC